jgi:hypothetical protein
VVLRVLPQSLLEQSGIVVADLIPNLNWGKWKSSLGFTTCQASELVHLSMTEPHASAPYKLSPAQPSFSNLRLDFTSQLRAAGLDRAPQC